MCIFSKPLNKKSIKNIDRKTAIYDNIVYKIFALNIGKAIDIINTNKKPNSPSIILATIVSPITCPISFLFSLHFTISFVADNTKPKSTKICI